MVLFLTGLPPDLKVTSGVILDVKLSVTVSAAFASVLFELLDVKLKSLDFRGVEFKGPIS